eukprot:s10807_g1.t1
MHSTRKIGMPLEDWINVHLADGKTLVASVMYTHTNDRHYGQWLPFRNIDDLWHPEADKLPQNLKRNDGKGQPQMVADEHLAVARDAPMQVRALEMEAAVAAKHDAQRSRIEEDLERTSRKPSSTARLPESF